jgi:RNA polymerase sigma-70 factor (ECF subfamily)
VTTKKDTLFKEFFDKHYEPLCLYAAKFVSDLAEAEDMVQDAFVKWWETIEKRPEATTRAYLYQMVHNACIDKLRRPRDNTIDINTITEETETIFQPESETDTRADRLIEAINNLPEKARLVFTAICVNDRKYKDVAAEMHVSVNTVKTQLSRGLRLLRQRLDNK